ncbi:MAG: hypothetical protein M1821_000663 [Bathelium mastoideum]|nr:MAG: hypothetical protein M1821_000663 [Bathelium mastoideum]
MTEPRPTRESPPAAAPTPIPAWAPVDRECCVGTGGSGVTKTVVIAELVLEKLAGKGFCDEEALPFAGMVPPSCEEGLEETMLMDEDVVEDDELDDVAEDVVDDVVEDVEDVGTDWTATGEVNRGAEAGVKDPRSLEAQAT